MRLLAPVLRGEVAVLNFFSRTCVLEREIR
jgi:hypothetical protein